MQLNCFLSAPICFRFHIERRKGQDTQSNRLGAHFSVSKYLSFEWLSEVYANIVKAGFSTQTIVLRHGRSTTMILQSRTFVLGNNSSLIFLARFFIFLHELLIFQTKKNENRLFADTLQIRLHLHLQEKKKFQFVFDPKKKSTRQRRDRACVVAS